MDKGFRGLGFRVIRGVSLFGMFTFLCSSMSVAHGSLMQTLPTPNKFRVEFSSVEGKAPFFRLTCYSVLLYPQGPRTQIIGL